jgi:hypothetical protein
MPPPTTSTSQPSGAVVAAVAAAGAEVEAVVKGEVSLERLQDDAADRSGRGPGTSAGAWDRAPLKFAVLFFFFLFSAIARV